MMKKTGILLLSALLFCGCTSAPALEEQPETPQKSEQISKPESEEVKEPESSADQKFEKFLDDYIQEVCSMDYTTAHHYFEHPEDYGIDVSKCKISLGSLLPDEEENKFDEELLKKLADMNANELNTTNQQILEQLKWMYALSVASSASRFDYVEPVWSEMSGVQASLVDFFSEYQLYTEDDIEPMIELINDAPRYVEDALEYSSRQAEEDMLRLNLDAVVKDCQSVLDSKDKSPILDELDEEVERLSLSDAKTKEWKEKIHKAMNESFFPSFEKIISGLTAMKDKIGPIEGMAAYGGYAQEYYSLLLQNYTGCKKTPEELRDSLFDAINDCSDEYSRIVSDHPDWVTNESRITKTDFTSVEQIMPFLEEHYAQEFPAVEPFEYEVKALSDEQSKNGVVAYFVVPPIDSGRTYEIRYNKRDYGSDPSSLSFYDTFAHEGIPGHMYQYEYNREHFVHPAQYFLSCFGMQEGYATYAAFSADTWTGLDPDLVKMWKLSESYTNYAVLLMDFEINFEGLSKEDFAAEWGEGMDELYEQLAENPGVFYGYYYGCYQIDLLQKKAQDALKDKYDPVKFNNALLQAGDVEFGIVEENVQAYIDSAK